MSSSVGEVVAHLLAARDRLAGAAVTASRARADADQASAYYCEAARGSDHPKVRSAIVAVGVAGAKSDRVARLINEVREHITAYVNHIAPGAAPTDDNASESLPDGDRLVTEAEERGKRRDAVLRKQIRKAGDYEDGLKQGDNILDGLQSLQKVWRADSGPAEAVTSQPVSPEPGQGTERPQIDNPITSFAMAVAAVAVGFKGVSETVKRMRRRRSNEH